MHLAPRSRRVPLILDSRRPRRPAACHPTSRYPLRGGRAGPGVCHDGRANDGGPGRRGRGRRRRQLRHAAVPRRAGPRGAPRPAGHAQRARHHPRPGRRVPRRLGLRGPRPGVALHGRARGAARRAAGGAAAGHARDAAVAGKGRARGGGAAGHRQDAGIGVRDGRRAGFAGYPARGARGGRGEWQPPRCQRRSRLDRGLARTSYCPQEPTGFDHRLSASGAATAVWIRKSNTTILHHY